MISIAVSTCSSLSIGLAFRVNLIIRDQRLDQLPPLRFIHHAVQFFKIDQHFIDIVAGQFLCFNGLLLALAAISRDSVSSILSYIL